MTAPTRRTLLRAAAVSVAGLAGCTDGGDDGTETTVNDGVSGTVRVAGSSTVYPLTLAVGRRFSERHPDATVTVSSTGTGGGFADFFCDGRTDLNDASRPISDAERTRCLSAGVDSVRFRVGTDALTVVVDNDADWVDCVSVAQLASVWREGGADRWREVDPSWPDEPITLYGPTPASGTFDYMSEAVLGDLPHRRDHEGTEQDSNIVRGVAESPYAMGYFGFAYYRENAARVKALSVRGDEGCVPPALETAKRGEYVPLSRPLFVYVARSSLNRPVVREFVSFYLDAATTDLVSSVGYVPVSASTAERNRERFRRATD